MPNLEPITLDGHAYTLRHVGPRSAVWPQSPAANVAVLACTTMVARPLPSSNIPTDRDFAAGSWTGRLDDAGEASVTFPNAEASDGLAWRSRFDPGINGQRLQWVEVWADEYLEQVFCLYTVNPDRQQVQITGYDGAYLLKNAYERDWTVVEAPRDVFQRGTQVWVVSTVDNFPYVGSAPPSAQWTKSTTGTAAIAMNQGGGVILSTGTGAAQGLITATTSVTATGTWRASATIQYAGLSSGVNLAFSVQESSFDDYGIVFYAGLAQMTTSGVVTQVAISPSPSYALMLESDGEWVWAFVNGQLVGCVRRSHATTTSLATQVGLTNGAGTNATATVTGVLTNALEPFLMRGTDQGDYVLPGDSSTYPNGGLHGRYYNDLDLAPDSNRLVKILDPTRSVAYGSSGTPEYMNQQDAILNKPNPPGLTQQAPGAGSSGLSSWSAKWFGAIYLKLSQGNYTITLQTPGVGNSAVRVWVGTTQFGAQLIDEWAWTGASTYSATLTAASLAGTLPYGAGTVHRDGWYPIKIEYAVDATALTAPLLQFTPPASYTDPGGTALTSGSAVTVPATSLSPLGCIDQRFQGVSHFDLCQTDVLQAFGYQASLEPKQLESGLFPGVFAPRIREGSDSDAILEPDDNPRAEGITNYSNMLDATDSVTSVQGNGAGFQNGNTGQLQALVYDAPTLTESLFDVQGWQDFSDASFTSLLQALLNNELGLRLTPWQTIAADPLGRHRLADMWPLTLPPVLAAMRWRAGDGMRIQARDVNVQDTAPRQLLEVTPNFVPNGTTSVTATFASAPVANNYALYSPSRVRSPAKTLKRALFAASRWARNYQRSPVSMNAAVQGASLTAGATDTGSSEVLLTPGDQVIRAKLRIGLNSTSQALHVYVNGTDVTSTLNGPWSGAPLILDLGAVIAINSASQFYVQLHNAGGSTTLVQYQLLLDVAH